jgi:hypothetical protein
VTSALCIVIAFEVKRLPEDVEVEEAFAAESNGTVTQNRAAQRRVGAG